MIDRTARRQSAGVDGDDAPAEEIIAGHLDDAMLGEIAKVFVVFGEVLSIHCFDAEKRAQIFLVVYAAKCLLEVPILF